MKISDLESLNLNPNTIDEIEVDIGDVITSDEFNRKESSSKSSVSYRERAIEKLVELKKPFRSNCNIIYEMVKKFIRVTCPYCNSEMKLPGDGSGDVTTMVYTCHKCSCWVDIALGENGISISPPS